jgi:predicted nucleotidyltransferase
VTELSDRRDQTAKRLAEITGHLKNAEEIAAGKACVYATGSFGRGEASLHSDLDLFIVGKSRLEDEKRSLLSRLDEILIKADLISVTRKLRIKEFSGEGRYLTHYSVEELTSALGTPEDDVKNTLTARLLLLLESRPLVETAVYLEIIKDVVAAYWRDYDDHKDDFRPAFLANDILRLWRTFCVNYEARSQRDPDQQKAEGKLKNYKLKHSRLLTCYSAILYLLAVDRQKRTVSPEDALAMIRRSPTERLDWLMEQPELAGSREKVERLLLHYERFLRTTNNEEKELVRQFMDKETSRRYISQAYEFGDTLFEVLTSIGAGSRLHRLLVV